MTHDEERRVRNLVAVRQTLYALQAMWPGGAVPRRGRRQMLEKLTKWELELERTRGA